VLFIHPPLNNLCSPDSFFTFLYSFCERKSCQCMHKTCFDNFWRKATLALFFTFIYPFVALPHYLFLISIYNFVSLLSFLCDEIYFVWKKKTIWGVQNSTSLFFCFPPPHLKKLSHKQYIHQNNQKNILKFMQLVLFKHILKPISTTQIATWCPPSGPLDGKCRKNLTCGGHK